MNKPCKIWTKARTRSGYGVGAYRGRYMRAHRLAWTETYGPIPEGMLICHRCDVRLCVEPTHLFLGTHRDNRADCLRKGRQAKGELMGTAKKEAWEVVQMRHLAAFCGISNRELGHLFGVTKEQAWNIVTGRHWKHVPGGVR